MTTLQKNWPLPLGHRAESTLEYAPDLDLTNARLPDHLAARLVQDGRRIVIVGARGWIGQTALVLLRNALGESAFRERVVCFGSAEAAVADDVRQLPLEALASLPARPTILLHLAFLTKDKVAAMAEEEFVAANETLSSTVEQALAPIGVDRLFVASSGAAAFADDPGSAPDLRLYGQMKRRDEERFAAWGRAAPGRRVAIGRIYSVSGPWMNKHQVYALASFILAALDGAPIKVNAPREVWRSYVAVRELLSVVLALLTDDAKASVVHFETGGEALELADVAETVGQVCGARVERRPISDPSPNRYCGDDAAWRKLLDAHGLTHLSLEAQVAETAAFLAREVAKAARR